MKQVIKTTGTLFFLLSANFISIICASTGFVISAENSILLAKNEDGYNHSARVWFIPSENGDYGRVYFGFPELYPISAMNERGLVMERFIHPEQAQNESIIIPDYRAIDYNRIMAECTTIDEVLFKLDNYDRDTLGDEVILFVDRSDKAVLVKKDTLIFKEEPVLIYTSPATPQYGSSDQPEWYPDTVMDMIAGSKEISVDQCRKVLAAISQEITQYSNIYELKKGTFYLHHFHDFENYVVFDLTEELEKGFHELNIPDLFPDNTGFHYIYFTRITPQNNLPVLIFLIVSGLIYLYTLVSWPAIWLIRRQDTFDFGPEVIDPSPAPPASAARVIGCITAALGLIYLLVTYYNPQVYQFGLPRTLLLLSTAKRIAAYIPAIILLLTPAMVVFTLIAWYKKYWSLIGRLHYLLLTIVMIINLFFFNYWELIRIK